MKFIAHRGYSKYELENTNEAFLAAANRSYFGIETDIVKTKDNYFVLFHDDNLVRLAGDDRNVRELTYKELLKVSLNNKGTYHTYDYHITTLVEYLKICKHYNKYPVIELKWGLDLNDVDRIMEIILSEGMFDKSMIICYTYSIILYLKANYPDYHIQYLLGTLYSDDVINKCLNDLVSIDLRYDLVTKELVDRFHAKGLEVNAWTVDDINICKTMKEYGVDYITTNVLEENLIK